MTYNPRKHYTPKELLMAELSDWERDLLKATRENDYEYIDACRQVIEDLKKTVKALEKHNVD
jgi:hypothetical protein